MPIRIIVIMMDMKFSILMANDAKKLDISI